MKAKKLLLVFSVFFCTSLVADPLLLKQLTYVNQEWSIQKDVSLLLSKQPSISSRYFNDWISCHLLLVEKTLRQRSTATLSAQQKKQRSALLDVLHRYAIAKVFPVNDYLTYKNPIFIDRLGTHCAVGYLMQQSGSESLARAIDAKQKFAYVKEIQVPGVKEWASKNGFTLDELAWIQPGYPINSTANNMAEGLKGNVHAMCATTSGYPIYAAGEFTETGNGIACHYLAQYISGFAGFLWTSVSDDEPNGPVYAMCINNNKLYIGGAFTMVGSLPAKHIACYDLSSNQWSAIDSLPGTVRAITFYNNELFAGGDFSQLLMKWDGTQWVDFPAGMLYGNNVRVLKVYNGELYVGGDFELATGALRRNVVKFIGSQFTISGMGTVTPVNDFAMYNNRVYAACDAISGNDSCALAVFDNVDWQKVIAPNVGVGSIFVGKSIKKLEPIGESLYCAGDFTCMSLMQFGSNLMKFQQADTAAVSNYTMAAVLNTDSAINTLLPLNNSLFFGGNFLVNSYTDTLQHVGSLDLSTSSLVNRTPPSELRLYPIPAKEKLWIQSIDDVHQLVMYDVFGKLVYETRSSGQKQVELNLQQVPAGAYFLLIQTTNGTVKKQFMKQ